MADRRLLDIDLTWVTGPGLSLTNGVAVADCVQDTTLSFATSCGWLLAILSVPHLYHARINSPLTHPQTTQLNQTMALNVMFEPRRERKSNKDRPCASVKPGQAANPPKRPAPKPKALNEPMPSSGRSRGYSNQPAEPKKSHQI